MKITIGECDACHTAVPSCFLKTIGPIKGYEGTAQICHPCYSGGATKSRKLQPFFAGKTKAEINRLRRAVPAFPESLPMPTKDKKTWAEEFANSCNRKAKWYGFQNVLEFFGCCLK